jgi:hypothetical protein
MKNSQDFLPLSCKIVGHFPAIAIALLAKEGTPYSKRGDTIPILNALNPQKTPFALLVYL